MDLIIAAALVIALMVVFEVKSHKHSKPIKENLQAVRDMKSIAKPIRRHGEQNA